MDANLFRDFFDHHRLQMIDAELEKVGLSSHNGLADFQNRLLPLLDILDQLQSGGVTLFDVVPDVFIRLLLTIDHPPVLAI